MSENIVPHQHTVSYKDRVKLNGANPQLIWLTGLSGSGKSTLANALEYQLYQRGVRTYLLDGDNIRSGLNKDLDFSEESRKENIRRIAEVSKLFLDAGLVVITAFISPFKAERDLARSIAGNDRYLEVFVECPLEICEQRDVKGLYARARKGEIKNFTGIDSPFEVPDNPDLTVHTAKASLEDCLKTTLEVVTPRLKI